MLFILVFIELISSCEICDVDLSWLGSVESLMWINSVESWGGLKFKLLYSYLMWFFDRVLEGIIDKDFFEGDLEFDLCFECGILFE